MAAVKTAPTPRKLTDPPIGAAVRKPSVRRVDSLNGDSTSVGSKLSVGDRFLRGQSNASDGFTSRTKTEYCEGNLQFECVIETPSDVMCVRFNPTGSLVAAGFADSSIKIYNAETGQCLHSLISEDLTQNRLPVTSVRFCPSTDQDTIERTHMLMATYATGHVRFWHYTSGKCMHTINELRKSSQTLSSAFNPLGDRILTVGADPQIYMYDVATKKRINSLEATDSRYKMDGHRCRVFAVQYHPNEPNVFLTGGWDDTVQFWDDRARHSFRKIFGPHICGDALDIDPMHGHILTGSWRQDKPLQIWDFGSGDKIKDVPDDRLNSSQLYCAQWLGKENIVCGGSSKNLARVIDRGTLNSTGQLVELPQGVYCIDNDRIGVKPAMAVGAAKKIYVIRMATSQAMLR